MRRLLCWLLVAGLAGGTCQADDWHFPPAPFRAVYRVLSQPDDASAGFLLEVPICGLGERDGGSVFVYNHKNERLLVAGLGPGRDNAALVVAGREDVGQQLFAYFGAAQRPPQAFTRFDPGPLLRVRRWRGGEEPKGAPALAKLAEDEPAQVLLPLANLELGGNPYSAADRFLIDFQARLRAPQTETWSLFLYSDGPSALWSGEVPVLERGDRQGRGRKSLTVMPTGTPIRVLAVCGERPRVVLARYFNERRKQALAPAAFLRSGGTRLVRVEGRSPCPVFDIRHQSYLGLEEGLFTEVELLSPTGDELAWRLGNGLTGQGQRLRFVAVGTDPVRVVTDAGKFEGQGTIQFGTIPRRANSSNEADFRRFADLIAASQLAEAEPKLLEAYLRLLSLRDREPACVPVARAWLGQYRGRRLNDTAQAMLLALARSAAARQPELAAEAWQRLDRADALEADPALRQEYWEFVLYRQGIEAFQEATRGRSRRAARPANAEMLIAAALLGNLELARREAETLQANLAADPKLRSVAIRANAALERYRNEREAGRVLAAEAALREWIALSPSALLDGHYVLLRCQWLLDLGWPRQVPALVDAALALNDLPGFLPELLLVKAQGLERLEQREAAQTLYRRIAEDYPNHPVAPVARRLAEGGGQ